MAMMPVLDARERLHRIDDIALGNGAADDHEARRVKQALKDQASGPRSARPKAMSEEDAGKAGIGLRVSPPIEARDG
jgi:hypothetical protein